MTLNPRLSTLRARLAPITPRPTTAMSTVMGTDLASARWTCRSRLGPAHAIQHLAGARHDERASGRRPRRGIDAGWITIAEVDPRRAIGGDAGRERHAN